MKKILLSNKQAGFSLVELSIIITIASILAAGYLAWTVPDARYDAEKAVETKQNMEAISEAIERFYITNQRLPCPAIPTLNSNSAPQSASNTDLEVVRAWDDEGFYWNNGIYTCPVSLGGLPTRALGLPSTQMFDGWGRRLLYHVNPTLCNNTACTITSYQTGTTTLNQSGSQTMIVQTASSGGTPLTSNAAYVLLSFGANGLGGYLPKGSQVPTAGSDADETENNNSDTTYVKHGYAPSSDNYYDDLASFSTTSQIASLAQEQAPVDYTSCNNNSSTLVSITASTASTLKSDLTALQMTATGAQPTYTASGTIASNPSSTIYNTGDTVALEIMWNLQEACYALYGMAHKCPADQTYNANTNSCTCANGQWNTSGGC